MDIKLTDRSKNIEQDDSLYVNTEPYLHFKRGIKDIANESDGQIMDSAKTYLNILRDIPLGSKIAILGGGACVLPRMLGVQYQVDVYEIEQGIIDYMNSRINPTWNWIFGDWHDGMAVKYDAVFLDTGEEKEINRGEMEEALNNNGLII